VVHALGQRLHDGERYQRCAVDAEVGREEDAGKLIERIVR